MTDMPKSPNKYRAPGSKTAAQHRADHDKRRGSAASRGYGEKWRKLRAHVLSNQPICQADDCNRPATDVDHIIAKAKGGTDDITNLQGLCHRCHSRKTATEDGGYGHRGKR